MSSSVEDQVIVAAYSTPHMAWTEENPLNVPRVCLASVMERKEKRQEGGEDVLSSFRETWEAGSKEKVRVVLV